MTEDRNTPEIDTLARYLDAYREVMVWKLDGVEEADLRRPMVASGTSLLGLVKHLAFVERRWFQAAIAGRDVDLPDFGDGSRTEWVIAPDETRDDVVALYHREVDESRRILAEVAGPDDLVDVHGEPVSVRRILIHMVEETARHAGHADILRELIDGATGTFPWDDDDEGE
jgi:uncharacterized damage-inducible protein DinB